MRVNTIYPNFAAGDARRTDILGRFTKYVDTSDTGGGSNVPCNLSSLASYVLTLTR